MITGEGKPPRIMPNPEPCQMKTPAYHFELLNEIHAQAAARKTVAPHHFSIAELNEISFSIGDGERLGELNYNRADQPRLVAATVAEMARLYPHSEQD